MNYIKIILVLCLFVSSFGVHAQETKLTRTYKCTPLSETLRDISRSASDEGKRITFIYDNLEDYTVTCSFSNLGTMDAIFRVIGLYPIRVMQTEDAIIIEPIRQASSKLIGRLIDEKGAPVEFATVRLYNPLDTTFITGGATNENGDFVIPVNYQNLMMKISCIGYKSIQRAVSPGRIGTITIYTNPTLLNTLTVTEKAVDFVDGHIEAKPSTTQVEHSYNFFSLLNMQPFPGLEVDEVERTISAFGAAPIILVNGIERNTSYLMSLQPKNVAKINYYTTVPPKYLASGANVVIDIIMKSPKEGGSFFTEMQTSLSSRFFDGDLGFTYNQGKSEFLLKYSTNYRNYHDRFINKTESFVGDDFRVDIEQTDTRAPMHYWNHYINADYTYRPDNNQALVASADIWTVNSHNYQDGWIKDSYMGNYQMKSKLRRSQLTSNMNVYYQKNWEGGRSLEANVSATYQPMDYTRNLTQTYEDGGIETYPSNVETDYTSANLAITYQHPINKNNALTFNLGNAYYDTRSHYEENGFDAFNKSYRLIAFGAWSTRFGKSRLVAHGGLNFHAYSNNDRSWSKPFFNASLSYSVPFGKGFTFTFASALKPIVPQLSELVENDQRYDGYIWVTGNPQLKTGYYLNFQPKLWFSTKKFWTYAFIDTQKGFRPNYLEYFYLGDKQFKKMYVNAESTWKVSPTIVLGLREVFDKHFSARFAISYNNYYARLYGGEVNRHKSIYCMLNLWGYFGKWTVAATYKKPTVALNANMLVQEENLAGLSVDYRLNKSMSFRASWRWMLDKRGTYYPSESIGGNVHFYDGVAYIKDNYMQVEVGFRYDINFGRIFKRVRRSLNGNNGQADVKFVQ